jgi:hypothetical protein
MLAVFTARMLHSSLALIFIQNKEKRGKTQLSCRVLLNKNWMKSMLRLRTFSSKIHWLPYTADCGIKSIPLQRREITMQM